MHVGTVISTVTLSYKAVPEDATDRCCFCQTIGSDAKMRKLKLLSMQALPVAKAVLRTPVMKEPCLFHCYTTFYTLYDLDIFLCVVQLISKLQLTSNVPTPRACYGTYSLVKI